MSPERSQLLAIGSALLAFAISVVLWKLVRLAITIAHEGSHALTASLVGGSVESIHLHRTGGGTTRFGGAGPIGKSLVWLAGYLGPSAFGIIGAVLLAHDRAITVLWLTLFFLLLALLQIGNPMGAVAVIATGAVVVLLLRYATVGQQTFFAYTWIWFLLFGGYKHVRDLQRLRNGGGDDGSDAYKLRKQTHLPASLWSGFFWLATLVATVYGGGILLELIHVG